ncbi:hypothetical protein EV383_2305 [Pseudonocardia sediminis]|uniref:DOD-type homing endonuclease domain-containing protein n=1 Tax=Pseudonocardia sediminis TaxID=1397368 RepID=A0A4Q7UZ11_PSEST|nr:hypothetical protein [Pseudonocardia sediminis]RZT85439.1 hypothetical protein EV383_2305 [Pseudonocardia sediminis]
MVASGLTTREVSEVLGVPAGTIRHWRQGNRRFADAAPTCPRCSGAPLSADYPYLLGAYLGDGHITIGRRGVASLSIACGDDWPGIKADVEAALGAVLGNGVCRVARTGCTEVKSYSKHWVCLFPQHGPGRKHERPIVLEEWQSTVVDANPARFLRGLFHSDGCRMTNWTRRTVDGVEKRYEYPRWFFSNKSLDILDLCSASLDRLGVAHRRPRWDLISVARREAVEIMDREVGPKT